MGVARYAPTTLPKQLLRVDDQEDTRMMLAIVLERCGARVTTAPSAAQAAL
ncbi:MAG: hypothetical protein KY445_09060 [Armatimonadetes bacterium]|nr:hypothetical protein [Armatimonadota bacterium]